MIKNFLGYLLTFGGISQFTMTLVRHLNITMGTKFYLTISLMCCIVGLLILMDSKQNKNEKRYN